MPCLNVSTNVNLEGVDTSAILGEASTAVANIIGKPEAVSLSRLSLSLCPFLSLPLAIHCLCRMSLLLQLFGWWRLCFHYVIASCILLGF